MGAIITVNPSTEPTTEKEHTMRIAKNIVIELWQDEQKVKEENCQNPCQMWKISNRLFDEYPDGRQLIYENGTLKFDLHCETVGGKRWKKNAIVESRRGAKDRAETAAEPKTTKPKKETATRPTKNIVIELWQDERKVTEETCPNVSQMWKISNRLFDEYPNGTQLIYHDGVLTFDLHCEMVGGKRWKKNAIAESRRHAKKEDPAEEPMDTASTEEITYAIAE